MTEYLILSLNRALPLVWEYNRQITFNLTFSRTYGNIPQSVMREIQVTGTHRVLSLTRLDRKEDIPGIRNASPALGHRRDKDQQAEALQDRIHTQIEWTGKSPVPDRPALRESR
jgi:hypothetical protein